MPSRKYTERFRPFSGYIPTGVVGSSTTFDPLDKELDLKWAGRSREDTNFNSYFDYFFSGSDVKIYIDGLFSPADELEISSFNFTIKQEKQPLYGFWSYNYDAVMYGSRIVAGNMVLVFRYPRRMTDLLEKAAKVRTESVGRKPTEHVISLLSDTAEGLNSEDEKNIQKYWARSQLDRIANDPGNKGEYESYNKNIFSAHPPFNLIIYCGTQEDGLSLRSSQQSTNNTASIDNYDRILSTDYNTRLTKITNQRTPMKIVLQSVQLMNMSTGYDTAGSPIQEAYEFIAKDTYFTIADESTNPLANLVIEETGSKKSDNTQTSGPGSGKVR